jgi:hypothetical protein
MMKRPIRTLAIGLLAVAIGSSAWAGSLSVQWGNDPAPPVSDGGSYKKKGGPPPHAPAHGYRAKHQYRYYPCCNVYHEPARGMYFWLKGDGWAVGASLPADLMAGLGAPVNLDLDTDTPYTLHADHVQQYPKEKYQPAQGPKK